MNPFAVKSQGDTVLATEYVGSISLNKYKWYDLNRTVCEVVSRGITTLRAKEAKSSSLHNPVI